MPQEINITIPGLNLAAKQWGKPDGMPVFALHGWLDNAGSFDYLAPLLPQLNLIALDLPGHGHSAHLPTGMCYYFPDYVRFVLSAADSLGWKAFSIIGHSLGGAIATMIASGCPERIDKLVLIDALGPLSEEAIKGPHRLGNSVRSIQAIEKKPRSTYQAIEAAIKTRALAGSMSEHAATPLVERAIEKTDAGYEWRFDRRLSLPSTVYFTEEQILAFLNAITAPSLLIQADHGLLSDNALVQQRLQHYGSLEQHYTLPGHHHLHLETPEAVAKLINEWL